MTDFLDLQQKPQCTYLCIAYTYAKQDPCFFFVSVFFFVIAA